MQWPRRAWVSDLGYWTAPLDLQLKILSFHSMAMIGVKWGWLVVTSHTLTVFNPSLVIRVNRTRSESCFWPAHEIVRYQISLKLCRASIWTIITMSAERNGSVGEREWPENYKMPWIKVTRGGIKTRLSSIQALDASRSWQEVLNAYIYNIILIYSLIMGGRACKVAGKSSG